MAIVNKKQGDAGATGGNDEGDDGDENNTPSYVSAEDFDKKLNAAISAHTKRLEKKFTELLATKPKTGEGEAEGDPAGDKAGGTKAAETDPALKKLEAKLAAMEKERDAERSAREQATAAGRRKEERAALATGLRDAGVINPVHAKSAQAMLESEGRIVRDDDTDEIMFKTFDKYGTETLVPLIEGLSAWTKSDEGAHFLPARKVDGSGGGNARTQKGGHKLSEKQQKDAEAREVLSAFLSGDLIE